MSLKKYLEEGKMEVLKRKVELSTDIQLKTLFYQLICKDQLKK